MQRPLRMRGSVSRNVASKISKRSEADRSTTGEDEVIDYLAIQAMRGCGKSARDQAVGTAWIRVTPRMIVSKEKTRTSMAHRISENGSNR
jgi:hypothetical protein